MNDMNPVFDEPKLNADIEVGDTVFASPWNGWRLWGEPRLDERTVIAKSAAGRLKLSGERGYVDWAVFKTREAALENYRKLAESRILKLRNEIEELETFTERCRG